MRPITPDRGAFKGFPPIHIYDLSQQTLAGYWQQTIGLLPTTDFSYGARVQNTSLSARDRFDPNAPVAPSTPRPPRSTATRRNTRCMSASSIASTTCSRCSAAPRARSARPTSTSACVRPLLRCLLQSDPRKLHAEDPDLARHRGRLSHQGRPVPDAIEHLQHGPRQRDPFRSRHCSSTSTSIRPAATAPRPARRSASATACCCAAASPIPGRSFAKVRSPATTFRWCRATRPMPA